MDEDLREWLGRQPWEQLRKMLTAYARMLLKRSYWRGEAGGLIPGGKDAEDFAQDAICAVYAGTRQWKRDTCPDFHRFLFGVVQSMVSNAVTTAARHGERREHGSPERAAVDPDDTFFWGLYEYLKPEPDLQELAECIYFEGFSSRAEIAERLCKTTDEITNMRKRMRRRITDFRTICNE